MPGLVGPPQRSGQFQTAAAMIGPFAGVVAVLDFIEPPGRVVFRRSHDFASSKIFGDVVPGAIERTRRVPRVFHQHGGHFAGASQTQRGASPVIQGIDPGSSSKQHSSYGSSRAKVQ